MFYLYVGGPHFGVRETKRDRAGSQKTVGLLEGLPTYGQRRIQHKLELESGRPHWREVPGSYLGQWHYGTKQGLMAQWRETMVRCNILHTKDINHLAEWLMDMNDTAC